MDRFIDRRLTTWAKKTNRKPIILRGARQVGKTFSIRHLGAKFESAVEINFERSPQFSTVFERDLDPGRIVRELQLAIGQPIVPGKTLLFFDEIQEAPRAILSLRYFYEEMPDLHVIAAGSLLEFQIAQIGMPVGRVEFAYLYPMSFIEFLWAYEERVLAEQLTTVVPTGPLPEIVHNKLIGLVAEYLTVGGMPEAVKIWLETHRLGDCLEVHHSILESYRQDFIKYARVHQVKYVEHVFGEVPRLVGQKIKFSNFSGDFRSRELRPAIELLIKGCLFNPILHSAANGIPLGAEVNHRKFKLIFVDIGLMQTLLGNNTAAWVLDTQASFVNRGTVVEAFVGQELLSYAPQNRKNNLYYWHREARSSNAEVDYVTAIDQRVIPIEVKSGSIGKNKSLDIFLKTKDNSPYGVLISPRNFIRKEKQFCLPIYHTYAAGNFLLSRSAGTGPGV